MAEEEKKPRVDYSRLRIQKTQDQVNAEELLERLDKELDRVKLQYQLYFIGTISKPPYDDRVKLDRLARFCRQNIPTRTQERFRMHNLLTKVANYTELWDKTVKNIEEGKTIAWVPITLRAEEAEEEATAASGNGKPAGPKPASTNGKESSGYLAVLKNPLDPTEQPEVLKVFNSYVAARTKVDATTKQLSFEVFQQALAKQVQAILLKDATAVQFRIEIAEGRVSLKARPVKG